MKHKLVHSGLVITFNVVYDDNGRGARAVFKSLVLPNGANLPTVLTIEAKSFPSSGELAAADLAATH